MANLKTEHLSYVYSAGTPFEKKAVDDVSIETKYFKQYLNWT